MIDSKSFAVSLVSKAENGPCENEDETIASVALKVNVLMIKNMTEHRMWALKGEGG